MASADKVWQLAAAQLLNAAFIAVIAGLGISYVQDLLPTRPGRATTLYSNASRIGAMLAGAVVGLGASVGYRTPYVAALGLTSVGGVLLAVGARSHRLDLTTAPTATPIV
jgi:SET family sugar efflux transporter-like MFS transporter